MFSMRTVLNKKETDKFRNICRYADTGHAQGRNRSPAMDQKHIAADIEYIHDQGAEHRQFKLGKSPEKGNKSHVHALDENKYANPS